MLYDVSHIGLCFKDLRYRPSSLSLHSFPSSKEGLGSLLRLILLERVVCARSRSLRPCSLTLLLTTFLPTTLLLTTWSLTTFLVATFLLTTFSLTTSLLTTFLLATILVTPCLLTTFLLATSFKTLHRAHRGGRQGG